MSRTASTFGKPSPQKSSTANGDFGARKSRNTSSSLLRKSSNNGSWASGLNLTGKASKTQSKSELADIEAEYIKNLQQQIYFLELESNYLREQARKATELHPKMTVEAERMLVKLRKMQNDMDEMQLEMRRKDNSLNVTLTEKERTEQLLKAKEDNQQHEKLVMREEIITLKKAKDRLELEGARKNSQLLEAKTEVDKSTTALRNAEFKLNNLKSQLDQRTETLQMTQIALEEKRAALMATESQLRDAEDRLYTNTQDQEIQGAASQELRDEVRILRQNVKELELTLEKERFQKEKMEDENAILTRENSNFNRRLSEYQRLLDKEKDIRENIDLQQRENVSQLITLRDREKQLDFQLSQTQSEVQREKERCQNYLEQLTKQENLSRSMESELTSTKLRLAEIESMHQVSETENSQLRKDKMLLVDHVAELQRKIETKDHEILSLQSEVSSLQSTLHDLDYQKNLESTVHSQKWQEFGRLAESMRTLSSTMASSTSPTHNPSNLLQY